MGDLREHDESNRSELRREVYLPPPQWSQKPSFFVAICVAAAMFAASMEAMLWQASMRSHSYARAKDRARLIHTERQLERVRARLLATQRQQYQCSRDLDAAADMLASERDDAVGQPAYLRTGTMTAEPLFRHRSTLKPKTLRSR